MTIDEFISKSLEKISNEYDRKNKTKSIIVCQSKASVGLVEHYGNEWIWNVDRENGRTDAVQIILDLSNIHVFPQAFDRKNKISQSSDKINSSKVTYSAVDFAPGIGTLNFDEVILDAMDTASKIDLNS